jgi:hypothetical protein
MSWVKLSFLKGLIEDVYYKNVSKLELNALMWKFYIYIIKNISSGFYRYYVSVNH